MCVFACLHACQFTETIQIGALHDFFLKLCTSRFCEVWISGKSCVQAAKDALAESRRLVVDRCNCTRLQRRASRWRFRWFKCFRNVQTVHYFSDPWKPHDMKYVHFCTSEDQYEIPSEVACCLFQAWNLLVYVGLLVYFMSSTSHLRSGWSLQTIMKLEQLPGKTWQDRDQFVRPTAFSLSDNCSAKNPRFACGWIFQRRVLEQLEGVQLFTTFFCEWIAGDLWRTCPATFWTHHSASGG